MAEFMELLESIQTPRDDAGSRITEVADNSADDGRSVRSFRPRDPQGYNVRLAETAKLVGDVVSGKQHLLKLVEAFTTSDFPILFGDILERQMLAAYETTPIEWRSLVRIASRNDFRTTALRELTGGLAPLEQVKETGEYPQRRYAESQRTTYKLNKYGSAFSLSWETAIMEDVGFIERIPRDMAESARITEEHFVTGMYVDADGPNSTLYSVGNANIITGNKALNMTNLAAALTQFASRTEATTGRPIILRAAKLVVPPALELVARNLVNTTEIRLTGTAATNLLGGAAGQEVTVNSPLNQVLQVIVNPLIPFIATSNSATTWFLFADATAGRAALEVAFLRGRQAPEIFVKGPDASRVGGGAANPLDGDFDHDEIHYKVRHVLGGGIIDPWLTMASDGTGGA